MGLRSALRRAFAVDPPGESAPTPDQQACVDRFCEQVARRRLTTPAMIALEMSRPLNFLASQALHFFAPGVWAIVRQQTWAQYRHFAAFLEKRGSVDYLMRRIEHFEHLYERKERAAPPDAQAGGDAGPPADPPPPRQP